MADMRDTDAAAPEQALLEHEKTTPAAASNRTLLQRTLFTGQILLLVVVIAQFVLFYRNELGFSSCHLPQSTPRFKTDVALSKGLPEYYQTSPELWAGPTPTGPAAFLAATNPAPFPSTTYLPNAPLETQVPIKGRVRNGNIFEMHGQLSHYFPNPDGFGVDEYALPHNASIVQLHMLHRHGARYPTVGAGAQRLGEKLQAYKASTHGEVSFTGELSFLNDWEYKLGNEILVPIGKQELFDSGTLHQIMYGHLYPNDDTKILVRSTTQDRMVQSAEYFLAGFFGLDWPKNATLLLNREDMHYVPWNNTLAGYYNCPNSRAPPNRGGLNASREWYNLYMNDAAKRLNASSSGFPWLASDAYNAQSLCAYETVALGFSQFCGLFTYEEWEGYEYSIDINFAGENGFQSPTGRAIGIGYVQEVIARLEHHLITKPAGVVNTTLDGNEETFPLDQTLYLDFTHDTNIMSILTAFGLKQFAEFLPATHLVRDRQFIVSHMEPFAARLDIEIIEAPTPIAGARKAGTAYEKGKRTKYVHFILNQRTLPLGVSYPECGERDDGWCELETFLKVMGTKLDEAQFEYACFGEYEAVPYGTLTDGVPPGRKG
ncbi:histidine phosphatase superfamily [Neohortaea acidophila]|uniref:3-phytase n=1 Tax=Neohortaea acidophila TaxID=245834 RepID=A0A6A6PGV8_9PEZI|nr:histidine phosphatase superfamily [Neohortaea acidophila]KAF2479222.1 histidine phosphatase superfamily [Neohortaea acidophila]